MSITINDEDVKLFNPDSPSEDEIIFDIRFECSAILKYPMKWEVTYVTSSHNYDQTLVSTLVGPISVGTSRFALRAEPPKLKELPFDEITLAGLLVTVFYNDQEFYRIGYMLMHEIPPDSTEDNIDYKSLIRHISLEEDDITTKVTQITWT